MLAVYKKELRMAFSNMIAYIFLTFMTLIIGIFAYVINFNGGSPQFELSLSGILFIYLLSIPILTMKTISEEKSSKTDQLLYSLPIPSYGIILGKFLALATILAIPVVISCSFPILLSFFGTVELLPSFFGILAFYFLGLMLTALCMFISATTESQVISAVISLGVLTVSYFLSILIRFITDTAIVSFISVSVLIALIALFVYFMTKKWIPSIVTFIIAEGVLTTVLNIDNTLIAGLFSKILMWFSFFDRFNNFQQSIIDVVALVYFITMSALFIFLTIQLFEKKKNGGYSVSYIFIAIAIVLGVNLAVNELPSSITKIDISSQKLYTLSDQTKQIVDSLDKDITIYLFAETGSEDNTILELVNRYRALNGKISFKHIDPVVNPSFSKKYTEETIESNSLLLVGNGRSKLLLNSAIYYREYDSTYLEYYGQSICDQYGLYTSFFDCENQITSAIDFLLTDRLPVLYAITSHSSSSLDSRYSQYVKNENIVISGLDLISNSSIPEDCSALLLNNPQEDITENELAAIGDYLSKGGDIILITSFLNKDFPNLTKLVNSYGMNYDNGNIIEGNTSYYFSTSSSTGNPAYLKPDFGKHAIVNVLASTRSWVFMSAAHGIKINETLPSGFTVTPLLTTSTDAYIKYTLSETIDKVEGDGSGPFNLGVISTLTTDNGDSNFVWYSSSNVTDSNADLSISGHNSDMFINSLDYVCGMTDKISIRSKLLSQEYLTVDNVPKNVVGIIFVIVIPLASLVFGFIVWIKRRKR